MDFEVDFFSYLSIITSNNVKINPKISINITIFNFMLNLWLPWWEPWFAALRVCLFWLKVDYFDICNNWFINWEVRSSPPPVVPVATTGICYVFNVYVLFTKKETGFMFFMLSNMLVYGLLTEEIGWAI